MQESLSIPAWFWDRPPSSSDDALGEALVDRLQNQPRLGGCAVALRPTGFEVFALSPLVQQRKAISPFISGLTRTTTDFGSCEAVGVIGSFLWRKPGIKHPTPIALVFLEWTDCRWWQWLALLEPHSSSVHYRPDSEIRRKAVEGDGKPIGLGGWWSFGRRNQLELSLSRQVSTWH